MIVAKIDRVGASDTLHFEFGKYSEPLGYAKYPDAFIMVEETAEKICLLDRHPEISKLLTHDRIKVTVAERDTDGKLVHLTMYELPDDTEIPRDYWMGEYIMEGVMKDPRWIKGVRRVFGLEEE